MNTLLLEPSDVLFFRDGRPMTGSLSGHGAAWPMPHTLHSAFFAALHRAGDAIKSEAHDHRTRRSGRPVSPKRDLRFGSLQSAGPFPVDSSGTWYFPRPLDAEDESGTPTLNPVKLTGVSSLPCLLSLVVENTKDASKDKSASWWDAKKFAAYLAGKDSTKSKGRSDSDIFGAEHAVGIGISPETGTQNGERFYTASYLRLKEGWKLGTLAATNEKQGAEGRLDLIGERLFAQDGLIVTGGQQRVCRVTKSSASSLPLPTGQTDGFKKGDAGNKEKFRVKWVLLTPAVFPEIEGDTSRGITPHPGGWLPNWIHPKSGSVLLKRGDCTRKHNDRETRDAWRARIRGGQAFAEKARLVAACTGKPLPVTGWSLELGAKSAHLAVPAGSVYYFECDSAEAARELAAALNWHGAASNAPDEILNRRSGIFGEKGFGLGLCGTW